MSITTYFLDTDRQLYRDIETDALRAVIDSGKGMLWVDVFQPDGDDADFLKQEFGFHPLVLEGAVDPEIDLPRVEDFGHYLFVNARSVDYTSETNVLQTADIGLFIGINYVVTVYHVAMPSIDAIKRLVEIDGHPLMKGPSFFAHAQFDALIEAIIPTLDRMEERAEAIEEQIIANPDNTALLALMALKRSALSLNRALLPQREVLSRLGRREFAVISDGVDIYFRDSFEDLIRVQTTNDSIRERTDSALATYLSVVGNRQNEIMKVLSIVATVFLPLGLVAGLFGMNFENMPGLDFKWGYHVVVGVTIAAIVLVAWVFWLKRWVIAGAGFFRPRRLMHFVPNAVDPARLANDLRRTVSENIIRTAAAERESKPARHLEKPVMSRPSRRWLPSMFRNLPFGRRRR